MRSSDRRFSTIESLREITRRNLVYCSTERLLSRDDQKGEMSPSTLRLHSITCPRSDRECELHLTSWEVTVKQNGTGSRFSARPAVAGFFAIIATLFGLKGDLMSQETKSLGVKNIVLVHGGFVDGSGWESVYNALKKDGYNVSIVQHPTISLAGDVAATKMVMSALDGPVILVGHSYGGVVITEAGNDRKVAGLVYVAAFAPDKGESVSSLIANPPAGAPLPPILPPRDGYLFLDRAKFQASFAADVSAEAAGFMADSQVPWGVEALNGAISEPAWRSKPSWYLITTEDKMIPPDAQRAMSKRAGSTVIEVKASHAVYVSQQQVVASFIRKAATAAGTASTAALSTSTLR